MKEEILKLRKQGKTYNEIVKIVGCSKSTVSYYCGKGQKQKNLNRGRKNRRKNPLVYKLNKFKSRNFYMKTKDFKKRDNNTYNYSAQDVLNLISKNPVCYLTGRNINIYDTSSYHFDHKKPISKGGDCSLENLGLACKEANRCKNSLTVNQFLSLCKEILEYNGYTVIKINEGAHVPRQGEFDLQSD